MTEPQRRWDTPIGPFKVEVGDHGVKSLALLEPEPSGAEPLQPLDEELRQRLDDHLQGIPAALKLDLQGLTPMTQLTLAKLLEIPFGEVRSYSWVAREIGRPTAVRAVASVVAGNPIPVLIPCHRVVRSDGHMGEYSLGGPEMKLKVLSYEEVDIEYLEALARRGTRFLASQEEGAFHLPSCRKGPRAGSEDLVEFQLADDALEKKLRPCPKCRPVVIVED